MYRKMDVGIIALAILTLCCAAILVLALMTHNYALFAFLLIQMALEIAAPHSWSIGLRVSAACVVALAVAVSVKLWQRKTNSAAAQRDPSR